jgi:hypothetical protein
MSRKHRKEPPGAGKHPELEITCPGCKCHLLVDADTGNVRRLEPRKKSPRSFESVLSEDKARRAASETLFGKALASQKDQQEVLERKFKEAIEKAADEPDELTPRPLDWD